MTSQPTVLYKSSVKRGIGRIVVVGRIWACLEGSGPGKQRQVGFRQVIYDNLILGKEGSKHAKSYSLVGKAKGL